jgi:TolB-like protein
MPNKLSQFWQELKRRKVVHVITVYAGAAFVIIELINNITEPLRLPEWTPTLVITLLLIGFPIAVIFSWIYDIHPDGGIVKTEPVHRVKEEDIPKSSDGWKIASYVSFVLIVGLIFLNIIQRSGGKEILDKSIAVLPFENMSDSGEFEHLGDAITDEIIMQLYKINEFQVRSRTSIMQYKETRKTSPDIGQELNVNYILEGSTQRFEDQVRIRVQLIEASTDEHLWGEVYEGDWSDIFDIQINVARKVAQKLKTVLSPSEIERIGTKPTESIEAYNLYLKGRYYWNKRTKDDLLKSINLIEEAIYRDSLYALAYSGLADDYVVLGELSFLPADQAFERARNAATKAIELDENLAEPHIALAAVRRDYDWDWNGAELEYLKGIELNPDYATAHQWYSEYLSVMGRHEEAIKEINVALELDPLSPIIFSIAGSMTYYYARRYDQALNQCLKAFEIDSNFVYGHYATALVYIMLERYDDATNEAKKAVNLSGGDYSYKGTLAWAYALSGDVRESDLILQELIERAETSSMWNDEIAKIYLALGMKDQAMDWLEKGLTNRNIYMIHLNVQPTYDDLREEPRFTELLRKVGFSE